MCSSQQVERHESDGHEAIHVYEDADNGAISNASVRTDPDAERSMSAPTFSRSPDTCQATKIDFLGPVRRFWLSMSLVADAVECRALQLAILEQVVLELSA